MFLLTSDIRAKPDRVAFRSLSIEVRKIYLENMHKLEDHGKMDSFGQSSNIKEKRVRECFYMRRISGCLFQELVLSLYIL